MTTYTYDLGAGGIRVVTIDRNACTLDGELVTQLEALRFMQDANAEGIKPTVTPAPAPLCACGLHPQNEDGYCPAEQTARESHSEEA